MKKKFFGLMVIVMLMVFPVLVSAEETQIENFLKVGDTEYNVFMCTDEITECALNKVKELNENGQQTVTIEVTRDAKNVPGFSLDTNAGLNFIIDFNGHTIELGTPLVGSIGTKSQNFQLKKGSTVVFKDGTLKADPSAKMLIQNYSDLTLENMTIDATTMTFEGTTYAVSSNCGKVEIKGETNIYSNSIALDVFWWNTFNKGIYKDGTQVTLNTTGTVKGEILVSADTTSTLENILTTLTIENVNHEGDLTIQDELKDNVEVKGGTYDNEKVAINITPSENSKFYTVLTNDLEKKYIVATEEELEEGYFGLLVPEEVKEEYFEDLGEENLKLIEDALEKKYTAASYYEIVYGNLINNSIIFNDKLDDPKELTEKVEVTLDIPTTLTKVKEGYTRKYVVVRLHKDSETGKYEATVLDAKENGDGTVTFKTDKFSTYVLAYEDVEDIKPAKTYDESISYILFTTISLIAIIGIGVYAKNRKAFN